jgi:phosphoglycerate dehydrogenase-like enzyme
VKVLIAIHHRVDAWTIETSQVDALRSRFPHVTFLHSTDRATDERLAEDADVAFALSLSQHAVERAVRLQWLHCSGHAVGHFPLADLAARRVTVTNSRGVQAEPIAEHVMACLLAFARQLPRLFRDQQERAWQPNALTGAATPWMLAGRTLAVVGVGTIGAAVASRAKAFGMRVVGVRRNPGREAPAGFDEVVGREALAEVLAIADAVVIAAPLTAETNQLLDGVAIAKLKPGAVVINVARGQLIDEAALADALEVGRLGGAALDVFAREPLASDSRLWSLPNVIVTPHTSGFRVGHFDAVIALFAENLSRFERGIDLLNVVDLKVGY